MPLLPINFPTNPTNGQLYTSFGGTVWKYTVPMIFGFPSGTGVWRRQVEVIARHLRNVINISQLTSGRSITIPPVMDCSIICSVSSNVENVSLYFPPSPEEGQTVILRLGSPPDFFVQVHLYLQHGWTTPSTSIFDSGTTHVWQFSGNAWYSL